jgi:hypothetical protein
MITYIIGLIAFATAFGLYGIDEEYADKSDYWIMWSVFAACTVAWPFMLGVMIFATMDENR